MLSSLNWAAQQLKDPQGRALAASIRWLALDLPGKLADLEWPVAVVGQGKPILMLHGFDSSFLEFRRLAPLLASSHQLWIPDLCGFGFSPRPPGAAYGPQLVLSHLKALLPLIQAANQFEKIGLIGASMGGAVALQLAMALEQSNPQLVDKMLLLAPAGITGKARPLPAPFNKFGVAFLGLPAVRRGLCRQAFADPKASVGPAEEEIASLHLKTPGWAESLATFASSGGFAEVDGALPSCELQVLWGANDRILPAAQRQAAATRLGDCCTELKSCGHLPHLDQPTLVASHWRQSR
ncbi:alpha/beta hydrolase [Synechococcus lacustris]|jgi:pimeloyl-ACP methyl ester carboxylesterase|uniref:alpha/beta fold hydrolase n=1 Tax=Synechococcus TaxID=1129 RepID=UPI0009D5AD9D|nr:alpha/beta hydrolase [Synechococcus lacustris]OON12856.1 MAG: alpha/beta hydrolase [Synechococcus lacustris str. Tous]MCP9794410.1 alpha/beta fold hydrolase [Synechococcus lacustris L1F-Slac]MCP9810341.1 alpha/beta fold hydrolase [Synechococcus lacustris Maggiore-St4-Slac]MCP9921900.1 alpha/beta fold hydrolase [Synechococcus lacustris Cruz CV12-2]MCP9924523.1 alpha/beta fold hydrolase [Synechococcus lacustris C3-12m-Tous]